MPIKDPVKLGIYADRQKYDDLPITYSSFSGADISAQIILPNESQPLILGELQTISYSIHRENKPVRVLGRVNPRGFVRGPRCIPATEKVLIKDRGYISIADVKIGDLVQSSGFTFDKVLGSWKEGVKPCFYLALADGYELTASYDHPVYTDRGWVKMEDLDILTDKVHVSGFIPASTTKRSGRRPSEMLGLVESSDFSSIVDMNNEEVLELAHALLADAYYHIDNTLDVIELRCVFESEELIDFVRILLGRLGVLVSKVEKDATWHLSIGRPLNLLKFYYRVGLPNQDHKLSVYTHFLMSRVNDAPIEIDIDNFYGEVTMAAKRSSVSIVNLETKGLKEIREGQEVTPATALRIANYIGDTELKERIYDLVELLLEEEYDTVPMAIDFLEPAGDLPVYDLEVENRHAFICNHVKVHNTIAGSMIFTVFNSYAFYRLGQYKDLIYGKGATRSPMFPLADMLPPFDLLLTFSNESGKFARMKILGMIIVDEGGTMSIEDIVSEQQFTYMANGIQPITSYVPSVAEYLNEDKDSASVNMIRLQ